MSGIVITIDFLLLIYTTFTRYQPKFISIDCIFDCIFTFVSLSIYIQASLRLSL